MVVAAAVDFVEDDAQARAVFPRAGGGENGGAVVFAGGGLEEIGIGDVSVGGGVWAGGHGAEAAGAFVRKGLLDKWIIGLLDSQGIAAAE